MKRIELKNCGVEFFEDSHEYFLNGKKLQGITPVLHKMLFPDEFANIPQQTLDEAAVYGKNVHKSLELFDSQWINDGSIELADYIQLCEENELKPEASEYLITDGKNFASSCDKIYRNSDTSFSIADIKTYGAMTSEKLEKVRWQLSLYKYMFLLANKKATVDGLFVIHLRHKIKTSGEVDVIKKIIPIQPIPEAICKDLLERYLKDEPFDNPFQVPEEINNLETEIRTLLQQKTEAEERLSTIKANVLMKMEAMDVKSWETEGGLRLTRKLPGTRSSFDLARFKKEHAEFNYENYMKTSNVAGSLTISL